MYLCHWTAFYLTASNRSRKSLLSTWKLHHGNKATRIPHMVWRHLQGLPLPQLRAAMPCFHHSSLLPRNGFWRFISCLSSFLPSLWPPSWHCSVLKNMWNHVNVSQLQDLLAQVCICQCLCFWKSALEHSPGYELQKYFWYMLWTKRGAKNLF